MEHQKKYGKAVIECIKNALNTRGVMASWGVSPDFLDIQDCGVFWKDPEAHSYKESSFERSVAGDAAWRYVAELDLFDMEDPNQQDAFMRYPALPIPFDAGQLAAFLMNGRMGLLITDLFGELGDTPDADEIRNCFQTVPKPLQLLIQQALEDAYMAYDKAAEDVGAYREEMLDGPEYLAWRKRMVNWLCGKGHSAPDESDELAESIESSTLVSVLQPAAVVRSELGAPAGLPKKSAKHRNPLWGFIAEQIDNGNDVYISWAPDAVFAEACRDLQNKKPAWFLGVEGDEIIQRYEPKTGKERFKTELRRQRNRAKA